MIPAAWLRLFNQVELNELLSGGASGGSDPKDMRAHTVYSGGYSPDSRTIKLFWQVIPGMCDQYPIDSRPGSWPQLLRQGCIPEIR